MDQTEPEEPTCILNMLNAFNQRVPAPQSFPFAFERVSSAARELEINPNQKESPGVKKRRIEVNESTLESDKSAEMSLLGLYIDNFTK